MENILEKLTEQILKLIRDELADSQVNKNKESAEYRLGKNEAYSKILSVLSKKETQNTESHWEFDENGDNIIK